MTNRELVSRVVNNLRTLNKDQHISRRFILRMAKNKAKFYIAQKLHDRSLYKEDKLYKTIKCFQLKRDDAVKCNILEFRRCNNLMKSIKKLPETVFSRFGASIVSISSVGVEIEFTPITTQKYALQKNRQFANLIKPNNYYIQDGYLYLPDSEIELVNVVLLPVSLDEVEDASGCKDEDACDGCKEGWDYEFNCPDKLLEIVIQETLKEIASFYKAVTIDENPNMDEHQKTQTQQ